MRTRELRPLEGPELVKRLQETYRELLHLRMRLATRQLANHRALRAARKTVARIKTLLRERELGDASLGEEA